MRRGLLRLGTGSGALWFVFWTFAYVLAAPPWESALPPAGPAFSLTTDLALIATTILALPWVILGFRAN
jgi:hypothetical protein